MSDRPLDIADYPLAENRRELVRGRRGKALDELTLEAVASGDVEMDDLRITPDALRRQAEIARAAGRGALAANFERAAEMTSLPQEKIMAVYEALRPGRVKDAQALLEIADELRRDYDAPLLAAFIAEAADAYERRGLFKFRY